MGFFNSISSRDKVEFAKNLAIMTKSGLTINEALGTLADQAKSKTFKNIIERLQKDVESGTSLSDSFSKEKDTFGAVFISLIKVGERSGTLSESLVFLSDWLERDSDLRQEIKSATLYPKIVFGATLAMGGGLTVYILPKLVPLFSQLRVDLPITTKLLLKFSVFMQQYWYIVLLLLVGLYFGLSFIQKFKSIRRAFDTFYIRAPVIHGLVIDYQLALVAQLFFTLLKSGIPIRESIEITSEAVTNLNYQEALEKIKNRVVSGVKLSIAMADYPRLFPKNMISIIAVGEKSGTIDISLEYLAEYYVKEVKVKTKKLPTVLEPVLLLFIAVVVGFIALSIIMPIYSLTSGVTT